MPGFDASGNYTRWYSWQDDATNGIKIVADRHDTEDDEFARGLSTCITKDGRTQPTANLPMNAFKLTNLAAGSAATDSVNYGQLTGLKSFATGITLTGAGSANGVEFTGAMPSGLKFSNISADLWFGVKASPMFEWNDKADATGNQIMSLTDTSTLTLRRVDPGTNGPTFVMLHDSTTPAINDMIAYRAYQGKDNTGVVTTYAAEYVSIADPTNGSEDGSMLFQNMTAGAMVTRLTLNDVGISVTGNVSSTGGAFTATGASAVIAATGAGQVTLRPNGVANAAGQAYVQTSGDLHINGHLIIDPDTTRGVQGGQGYRGRYGLTGGYVSTYNNFVWHTDNKLYCYVDNSQLGYLNFTPCDYRIKKDMQPLPSLWDKVKALNPISYTGKAFGSLFSDHDEVEWGFVAHELQETLIASAATGVKDEEGVIQSPNLMAIVAALTKALQEAMSRIEALEAKP
jgi:hypothetical protein